MKNIAPVLVLISASLLNAAPAFAQSAGDKFTGTGAGSTTSQPSPSTTGTSQTSRSSAGAPGAATGAGDNKPTPDWRSAWRWGGQKLSGTPD